MTRVWQRIGSLGIAVAVTVGVSAPAWSERPALPVSVEATPAPVVAFEPGETIGFTLHYLGMEVGTFRAEVTPRTVEGRELWAIETGGETSGLIRAVHPMQEQFTSFFDPQQNRAIGSLRYQVDGDFWQREETRFVGNRVWIRTRKAAEEYEQWRDVPAGSHDLVSAVYALRGQVLAVGASFELPVFTTRKPWTMKARVERRERLSTAIGERSALVVKLRTSFAGNLQAERELTLWVSDDAHHVPLRLDADFLFGSVSARVSEFRTGLLARR